MSHRISGPALPVVVALIAAQCFQANALAAASLPPPATIHWSACSADLVSEEWTAAWSGRLECGSMRAPLSYARPESGYVDVTVLRVKAGVPAERQGAIFFNFGGPGAHPADYLPLTAATWNLASANSVIDGDKRRLADRYDLVAVVPRGLEGPSFDPCGNAPGLGSGPDPIIDLADWNWAGFVRDAREFARRCGSQAMARYAGTRAHVLDMEHARRSLGEPVLNYIGVSYGSWVGYRYAVLFPEHMGRFVLDSSMDVTATVEQIHETLPAVAQDLFERHVIRQVVTMPAYGVTEPDTKAVMTRLNGIAAHARRAWMTRMQTPEDLAAVLTLGRWIDDERQMWLDGEHWDTVGARLRTRAEAHRFSTVSGVDTAIRTAAESFIDMLRPSDETDDGRRIGTYLAATCGDTPWTKSIRQWRATAQWTAARYPVKGGGGVMTGLICHHWPVDAVDAFPVPGLIAAPPMLLVHAEHDAATPLAGARRTLEALPAARMIVSRGMLGHGVFGMSGTPCVEKGVGRYLLTGVLPPARSTVCDFRPSPPSRRIREPGAWPTTGDLHEALRLRLQRS